MGAGIETHTMGRATGLPHCQFGDFAIDGSLYELRRRGRRVRIEPKALDLLGYLIRHRDRVVSKDELLAAIWPGEFVSEAALTYCVKAVRKAVGDTGASQRIIATVRSRGYRFIAAVDEQPAALPERPSANLDTAAAAPRSLPGSLDRSSFYVGREAAMTQLHAALANTLAGHGRIALIEGEPGIGKTRTAEEVAAVAAARGVRVLLGRCYEGAGAPAFWPWIQVVRAYLVGTSRAAALLAMDRGTADLAQIVPEIGEWLDTPPPPATSESPQTRFRLFDSMTAFLQRASRVQPLMVMLDDLHWADKPSLLLLQFLAQELSASRLLVLGTYRNVALGLQHPLTECLGDLARAEGAQHIALEGLGTNEVRRFIEATTGTAPGVALVEAVVAYTGGNPFFVGEIVRLLASEHAENVLRAPAGAGSPPAALPIPRSVREAVLRRTERLSAGCRRVLALAGVIGREFDLAVLTEALRAEQQAATQADALAAVDEAVAARLVEALPGVPARHRFAHALVGETLYGALAQGERARLHGAVGAAIEAVHRADLEPHVTALAHHFAEAAALGDGERAAAYARRAGDRAAETWAYEEAAAQYERALLLGTQASARDRLPLLLGQGENLWKAGELSRAKAVFQRAAALARSERAPRELARAALGYGGGFRGFDLGVVEPPLIELLEESLAVLRNKPSALLARVLGRLAVALYHIPDSLERRKTLSRDAVRMAERVGDPSAHLAALYSRHWAIWGPDDLDVRLAAAQAIRELAEQVGDREMALHGHRFHLLDALQLGDRGAVDTDLATCTRLAEELRQPYYRWYAGYLHAMRALLDGRFADAERLAAAAYAVGQRAESENVAHLYGAQVFWIRREQGRLAETEATMRSFIERFPALPSWRAGLALVFVNAGRHSEAQAQIDVIAADDFAVLPRNVFWLAAMAVISDVCATTADKRRAQVVYRLLAPYRHLVVESSMGASCYGAVARPLGRLAALLGRWSEAETHFERAMAAETRLGSPHLLAHSQRDFAESLLGRGEPRFTARAAELLDAAAATYARLGVATYGAAVAALQERLRTLRRRTAAKAAGRMRLVR
jgi:DNA-binding winged helix-turn-helix (wHTH) protein